MRGIIWEVWGVPLREWVGALIKCLGAFIRTQVQDVLQCVSHNSFLPINEHKT